MGIQFDLIIPPVIAGFIILALFSINSFMLETSVDTRLSNEMQNFANISVELLQNELRTLDSLDTDLDPEANSVRFVNTEKETVEIYREGRNLIIERTPATTSTTDTEEYPARLQSLKFTSKNTDNDPTSNNANTAILHFRAVTESTPEQQVGEETDNRIRAYAEKQVFLRNISYE